MQPRTYNKGFKFCKNDKHWVNRTWVFERHIWHPAAPRAGQPDQGTTLEREWHACYCNRLSYANSLVPVTVAWDINSWQERMKYNFWQASIHSKGTELPTATQLPILCIIWKGKGLMKHWQCKEGTGRHRDNLQNCTAFAIIKHPWPFSKMALMSQHLI